jgi:hypothetical protein
MAIFQLANNEKHSCQFHQHFMNSFSPNILVPKKFQSQTVIRELRKALLYEKVTHISADIFSSIFCNLASSASFLSHVIELSINATLSLPHPASHAPFLSTIMLRLIYL